MSMEFTQRDDCFRHRRMASGGSHAAECFFQHATSSAHVPDIPYRNDVIRIDNSADDCPFDPFERETEVRHLRNEVVTFDAAEIYESHLVNYTSIFQRHAERVECRRR